ncbi:MAG TPA: response regulator [Polyangia bacterium]|nr:response regulator [Polyangia bacterium]
MAILTSPSGAVLIVDDDRSIRESVGELLTDAGYEVRLAENGAVALDVVRGRDKPALVLLDMMMPVMSGFELLELLEEGDADLSQVPIVVVSAFSAPLGPLGARGGVKACLCKPVKADLLLETVETCCHREPARDPPPSLPPGPPSP